MPRWKMASEISQDRHLRLILALYGDDKLPIERHTVEFHENASKEDIIKALRDLADEL